MKNKKIYTTNDLDAVEGILDASTSKKDLRDTVRTYIMDEVADCVLATLDTNTIASPEELWEYLQSQKQNTYNVYKCSLEPLGSNFDFAYSRSFVKKLWKEYKDILAVEKDAFEDERILEQEERLQQYRKLYVEFGGLSPDDIATE